MGRVRLGAGIWIGTRNDPKGGSDDGAQGGGRPGRGRLRRQAARSDRGAFPGLRRRRAPRGWLVTVARDGKLVYVAEYGKRDIEADLPVEHDTIWRIYSMTKPITSLAAMMLWEQGRFDLNDPVEAYIPSFRNGRSTPGVAPTMSKRLRCTSRSGSGTF